MDINSNNADKLYTEQTRIVEKEQFSIFKRVLPFEILLNICEYLTTGEVWNVFIAIGNVFKIAAIKKIIHGEEYYLT